MDKAAQCFTTQMIQGDGTLNANALEDFVKRSKLKEYGCSYAIVSIMGPQSSGKSTLLNHLFHTDFEEMDASKTRSQTTKGVWIARFTGDEPCTIVMDIEGTDGEERGEDDTAFERQSALFAIAISDIVIINMWCHDIGRRNAANIPLMKNVFQVMLKILKPRKKTLMFVVRDKTPTPAEILGSKVMDVIQEIWDSIPKPEDYKSTHWSVFFNVKVLFLSNYVYAEKEFKNEVGTLRQKFFQSIVPGILADDKRKVVPASGFPLSAQCLWKLIKENKDLDLPSHTTMVANYICENQVERQYSYFVDTFEVWLKGNDGKSHLETGFAKSISSQIDSALSKYDKEVMQFKAEIVSQKRKELEEKLLNHVQPTQKQMFKDMRSKTLDYFRTTFNDALHKGHKFDEAADDCIERSWREFCKLWQDATIKQAKWDLTKEWNKSLIDLKSHIVRVARINELITRCKLDIQKALCSHVRGFLKLGRDDTWHKIRSHLSHINETIVRALSFTLSSFEMEEKEKENKISEVKIYAKTLVEEEAKQEVLNVLDRMKDRFEEIFDAFNSSTPPWSQNEDIPAIAKFAMKESLKVLSVLAVIRLDEDETDTIFETLVSSLVEQMTDNSHEQLDSKTWGEIPARDTLTTPIECKDLWDKFQGRTDYTIKNAIATQSDHDKKELIAGFCQGIVGGLAVTALLI